MTDKKESERAVVENSWKTLDDEIIVKDVCFKGKYINLCIKFLSERNELSLDDAKHYFLSIVHQNVNNLIRNKQLHRAVHVLKNCQIDELNFLYDRFRLEEQYETKQLIIDHLEHTFPDLREREPLLEANHVLHQLYISNIHRFEKSLNALKKITETSPLTTSTNLNFCTFMKLPIHWRNEVAVDVFFKIQNPAIRLTLDKDCFYLYILRNQYYSYLKLWLQEAYFCKTGSSVKTSTTTIAPATFDECLLSLFREWKFEPKMMEHIKRREKDVIKNDFAKLGLFEAKENKLICLKLNRFFTTETFHENFSSLKSDEITKFIIEQSLLDLLAENFIDHNYIKLLLENLDIIYMREELVLICCIRTLLTKDTSLKTFLNMINATSEYILCFNKNFNKESPALKLITETLNSLQAQDFHEISNVNIFTKNLMIKLNLKNEKLPEIENLLETYHNINIDFIREEFEDPKNSDHIPSFNDQQMSANYSEPLSLNHVNYVQQYQSAVGSFSLIKQLIKHSVKINSQQVLLTCVEIARLAIENPTNHELVSHVISFMEMFNIDTKTLRCKLRLKKLNDIIVLKPSGDSLRNIEALENDWRIKNIANPSRTYLNEMLARSDWFRLILMAQYLNYPLQDLVSICDNQITNKNLRCNLIRAILYETSPEHKKRSSFSKHHRSTGSIKEFTEVFPRGKFLDAKHDLFAVLLKCDEELDRSNMTFEDFQRMIHQKFNVDDFNDLLFYAHKLNWPIIAVLAAMTSSVYRLKLCWITWLILSSNYDWNRRFKSIEDLSKVVIHHCIEKGFIKTLDESATIFYPHSAFKTFTSFLFVSIDGQFQEMESLLKQFIVKLNQLKFDMVSVTGRKEALEFSIRCIVQHLKMNFRSIVQQEKYLDALCLSEISQFGAKVDFALVKRLCKILEHSNVILDFDIFCVPNVLEQKSFIDAMSSICEDLIDDNNFEVAIQIAELMELPKSDLLFKWWTHKWDPDDGKSVDFEKYIADQKKYLVGTDVLLEFLKSVSQTMEPSPKKLEVLKFILKNSWTMKPSEIDELEYEVICLYVKLKPQADSLQTPTSEYYNVVMSKEQNIHNPLFRLKEIARIDELSINKPLEDPAEIEQLDKLILELLDFGDIVQVLRIQEMFSQAPDDLRIFVYLMAISEGLASIYDISKEERQTISSYGIMSNRFNRLTLRTSLKTSGSTISDSVLSLPSISSHLDNISEISEEPLRSTYRENKETFQALQGLVCKLKHGVRHAQRIAFIYRASLFLERNFVELLEMKNSFEMLELVAMADCESKLMVMNDIMVANQMSNEDFTEFIAKEIAACIIRTRFLQFNKDTENSISPSHSASSSGAILDTSLWGSFSLTKDFHLILALCPNTTLLGRYLLKYFELISLDSDIPFHSNDSELSRFCTHLNRLLPPQVMSLKKKNVIRVELLIIAHESFCHECSTEGIGEILALSRNLCNILASTKSYNLIVKLLCGIGRYREMYYCFEMCIKNEHFEALLGQFNDKESKGLKVALISYLNEYHPNNKEYYRMAASHFSLYTELASIWRSDSIGKIHILQEQHQIMVTKNGRVNSNVVQQIDVPYLKCSKKILLDLNEVLTSMIHSTEMVTMDDKIDMAVKYSGFCELIAMQIHLAKLGLEDESKLCPSILNVDLHADKLQYFTNYELTVPQAMILMRNVEAKIDFVKAIYVRCLWLDDGGYLLDYMSRLELSDQMIESVVKLSQLEPISFRQEKVLMELLNYLSDKGLQFRLASLLGLKGTLQNLLNNSSYFYLLDTKYGNLDIL